MEKSELIEAWRDYAKQMRESYDEDPPECEDDFNDQGAMLAEGAAELVEETKKHLPAGWEQDPVADELDRVQSATCHDADDGHSIHWAYSKIADALEGKQTTEE